MSRRHHGRPHHHAQGVADTSRRSTGVSPGPITDAARPAGPGPRQPIAERPVDAQDGPQRDAALAHVSAAGAAPGPASTGAQPPDGAPYPHVPPVNGAAYATGGGQPAGFVPHHQPATAGPGEPTGAGGPDRNGQCTAPQLRRFIKSRPYVPMHELRRRFAIDGGDDDVTPVRLDPGWVYVGLPSREGSLLGDLLRAGEIGYELSLDPRTPIVIGVYPMRPIPRS